MIGPILNTSHPTENTGEQIIFEVSLPDGVWHLGHGEEEGEEVGEPEVVGGDEEVLVSVHLLGVDIAASSPALEVVSHISRSVDPAVGTAGRENLSRVEGEQELATLTVRIWAAGLRSDT